KIIPHFLDPTPQVGQLILDLCLVDHLVPSHAGEKINGAMLRNISCTFCRCRKGTDRCGRLSPPSSAALPRPASRPDPGWSPHGAAAPPTLGAPAPRSGPRHSGPPPGCGRAS